MTRVRIGRHQGRAIKGIRPRKVWSRYGVIHCLCDQEWRRFRRILHYVGVQKYRKDAVSRPHNHAITTDRTPGEPNPRAVIQVSRRTRRSDFTRQTALQKIDKVLDWIRTR